MSEYLILATGNGVAICPKEGPAWRVQNLGLRGKSITCVTTVRNTIIAGATDGIYISDDLGEKWRSASSGLSSRHVRWLTHSKDDNAILAAGTEPAEIYISTDNAGTWGACPEVAKFREQNHWYLPYSPEAGCVRGFAFHGERAYAAVEVGGVLRSDDRGQTWQLISAASQSANSLHERAARPIHADVHDILVHPSSPDLVYAPTGGGFYRSRDGGLSWEMIRSGYCRALWLDPDDPNHMILGTASGVDRNGHIQTTTDGGKTWLPETIAQDVPWPRHMVERLHPTGDALLAVLSNGELLVKTSTGDQVWRSMLPEVSNIRMVGKLEV